MKKVKSLRRGSWTVKVLRLLGGRIEVLGSSLHSQEEIHVGIPVNSLTNYSLVTNAELKKAQALMYWRVLMDRPK